ncbi:splicing factor 3b subunit 1 transcript variant 2 [Boletus coccyginus]|nr:splicing factor 3b subunit 1 transcript variant 2 [Boletus coccyginus]
MYKIIVVIKPLLINKDYYTYIKGHKIISNLLKATCLIYMISIMYPDINHANEYICNMTVHAFSIIASALNIPSLLPFLIYHSKKSWQAATPAFKLFIRLPS